mgnify:CR=1 FL=1
MRKRKWMKAGACALSAVLIMGLYAGPAFAEWIGTGGARAYIINGQVQTGWQQIDGKWYYLNEQGVIYYDWNVSAGDAASNAYSSEEIVANVMDDVVKYKTSVVLLHDASDKSATVEALAPLIEALNEMGAEILPIDEDTSVIQYVKADSID